MMKDELDRRAFLRSSATGLLVLKSFPTPIKSGQASQPAVERWDTHEWAFRSERDYSNPFHEVWLKATFMQEGGRPITVNGFYDGASTWRVRFMPLELGQWSFVTSSNDPALNGRQGTLECVQPRNTFLHGPLHASRFHFQHADGTRRFLISTRLSCQFAEASILPALIKTLHNCSVNRVLFMIGGNGGEFKLLYGTGPDGLWRYNVDRFRMIDRFIDTLRKADVMASPYLYYFNDKFQRKLTPEQDQAYIRYAMARFGAYCNVMPVLSNEVEQKYSNRDIPRYNPRSDEWANKMGSLLKSLAVFGEPVSVHNPMETYSARNPGFFTMLKEWPFPWADFQLRQMQIGSLGAAETLGDNVSEPVDPSFSARAYARENELLVALRRYGVPVIDEEPGYEMEGTRSWNSQTSITVRATFWTAITAGGYTMWGNPGTYETGDPVPYITRSHVPCELNTVASVMERIPYWKMTPSNDLVNADPVTICSKEYRRNFMLAKPGCYLAYSRDGGPIEMTVEPGDYKLEVIRLNNIPPASPLREYPKQISTDGSKLRIFAGSGEDWVILLTRIDGTRSNCNS